MSERYALSIDAYRARFTVEVNGAPFFVGDLRSSHGYWRLEPFVMPGANQVSVKVEAPGDNAWIKVCVLQAPLDGAWSSVLEDQRELASPETIVASFVAGAVPVPASNAAGCEEIGPSDRAALDKLLARAHALVRSDPGSDAIALFKHWIDFRARLTGDAQSAIETQLIEQLELLADPEFELAPTSGTQFKLICRGGLCLATTSDGRPALRADSGSTRLSMPLVFAKVDDEWVIVA